MLVMVYKGSNGNLRFRHEAYLFTGLLLFGAGVGFPRGVAKVGPGGVVFRERFSKKICLVSRDKVPKKAFSRLPYVLSILQPNTDLAFLSENQKKLG
jgi:hypothetical protein